MLIEITYNVTDVFMSTTETPVYVEISFEQPGGTSAVWGSITGTLSDQTDLQNALNLKVPYTGATTNVNLGEYELKAGQVTLDTSPTGTAAVGTIRWNDTTGTSETTLKGGSVVLKNGVDLVARVVNKVSPNTTLTKAAYQAVRVSGAQGQRLAVAFAQANNDANSADTIGLVTETIPTNQEGFIMTVGQLEGINTTGSLQGEIWADGDVLYLSPTTPGALTNIKPTAVTGHIVVVGYVEYAHANNGKIYVKVMNGWELDELHNVSIVTPTNNQGLFYNSSNSLWENKTISTALGYTPVPTTRNITINGVTYDLSADRTYTISTGISGSGAAGQVTYWTGASAVSGSNNLFWDNANGRLGIGTNVPTSAGHIVVTNNTLYDSSNLNLDADILRVQNSSATVGTAASIKLVVIGTGGSSVAAITAVNTGSSNAALTFATRGGSTPTPERMRLTGSGNLLINSTSDSGQRLQVYGDTLLRGSGATSATTALTVQNSSSTNLLVVQNHGGVGIGSTTLTGKTLVISKNITGSTIPDAVRNDGVIQSDVTNATNYFITGAATVAASFTLPTLRHYIAVQGTFGAGSTVTNQYGFFAHISMTGATNNYGFYGGIASGTGRWNLYMEGTADNYLAGNTGFSSTNPLTKVHIRTGNAASTLEGLRLANGSNDPNAGNRLSFYFSDNIANIGGAFIDVVKNGSDADMILSTSSTNSIPAERVRLTGNGNLGIGITPTVKLHVSGDTILKGSGATSATTALTVQNSSSTNLFRVLNDNTIFLHGTTYIGTSTTRARFYAGGSFSESMHITAPANRQTLKIVSGTIVNNIDDNTSVFEVNQVIASNGTITNVSNTILSGSFSPSSGSVNFNSLLINNTINQTGGANGITRGLYINPTLTSAADFRAIETTNGKIIFGNLPTSSAGLPTGALWNDAGTVKIV